jgi:hypothetical protein
MKFNDSCGTDAFRIESCPAAVQALCLLSLKLTLSACQTETPCVCRLEIFYFRKCFFHRVSDSEQLNKTMRNFLFSL